MPSRVLSSSGEFHHVTPSFQACPSCRAFFRRSVQARYNETFKCTKGVGDCEISLITRKNCQFCRYQRCIGAGMRPSWILSDEERVRRFHGRNKAVKTERAGSPTEGTSPESRSTGGTNSPLLVSPSRSPNPSTSLVEEERGRILSYGEVMLRSLAGRQEQVDRTLLTRVMAGQLQIAHQLKTAWGRRSG